MKNLKNCLRGPVPAIFVMTSGMILGANWRQINSGLPITVAGVKALIADSKTPSTLYASTASGSVFKTKDGGGSWTQLGTVTAVNLLIADPKTPSTLYAATGHGVLKSLDGGETWAGANNGLPGSGIYTLVADPKTPSTLYAPSAGTLFKSSDGAQTWNPVATKFYSFAEATIPLANALFYANALAIDPKNSSTMYAQVYTSASNLFKSTDGGSTWYPLAGVPANVSTIPVFDPVNPSTMYLGYSANLLKSTDNGANWTAIGHGVPANSTLQTLAIDPATPAVVYATYIGASAWGLIKSTDGGQTFNPVDTGLPPYNTGSVVAISPTSPPTVYAGYVDFSIRRGRLVKSGDGGATWNAADAGLTFIDIRSMAIDPASASTVYAGMGGGGEGVFKSVDGGAHWSNLAQLQISGIPAFSLSFSPQGEPGVVNSLLIGPANPNILYAATSRLSRGCIYTDKLFFKSTDGGVSWSNIANPPQGGCGPFFSSSPFLLALNPTNTDELFLAGGDDCGDAFLDQSPDAGLDWRSVSYDFASTLNALVIDPSNVATLYAGAPEGVFKSTNGGAAWTNIGLSAGVSALAMDPANPSTLYAATGGSYPNPGFQGMFKSIDGGASWAPINTGLAGVISTGSPVTALAIAPDNANILYAATSGNGVYRSSDGGASWAPNNDGLTNLDVHVLTVGPKAPHALYAVTPGGAFRMVDETPVSTPRR